MKTAEPIRRVEIKLAESLYEALCWKASRSGMAVSTYMRTLAIKDTGWKVEDGK